MHCPLPLTAEATAELVVRRTHRDLTSAATEACHEVTGGVPLLAVSLAEALTGASDVITGDHVRALGAPEIAQATLRRTRASG